MMADLSILLVVSWDPATNVGGVPIRWYQLQQALAGAGRLETFVADDYCAHEQFGHPLAYLRDASGPFLDPYHSQYCRDAQGALGRLVQDRHFDVVVFSGLWTSPYMVRLPEVPAALVLDTHNVQSALDRQLASGQGPGAPGWLDEQHLAGIERLERAAVNVASAVWACSPLDAAEMGRMYPEAAGRMVVVPNTVQVPAELPPAGPLDKASFIGRLDYWPNEQAGQFIVQQLRPVLSGSASLLQYVVAGAWPGHAGPGYFWEPDGVRDPVLVIENPPDVEALRAGAVSLVPLSVGGGTRTKILESWAAGSPVVSTAKGMEGIAAVPGEHYLPAETAAEFNEAIGRLVDEPELCSGMVRRAWELVRSEYSQQALVRAVRAALRPITAPAC
jgi:glycosyltransferase involved in cell wall biosynthesis